MLIPFAASCFVAAAMGAIFRPGEWYRRLDKPHWRPPDWLFAPVWAVLYVAIAVSGWLVWREAGIAGAALPLTVYALQLLLNAAWTPIFFGLKRPDLGLAEIGLLWVAIVATIMLFHPVSPTAAWLLVPYLAWVSFASALTHSVWRRNREPVSPSPQ
jgi:tryptophan-rich sensory protein